MPSPFYNGVKGTTAGTPGTGAFTPNAAASGVGIIAWSNVAPGWWGLVLYTDGTAWERQYSYWNGTTLSRGTNQFVDSSTGSALTLSSSATATMIIDGNDIPPFTNRVIEWVSAGNGVSTVGGGAPTSNGTQAAVGLSNTSFFTEQNRTQYTSATTANAQAGWSLTGSSAIFQTASGRGGYIMLGTLGPNALPTSPRLWIGTARANYAGLTTEPSAQLNIIGFGQDSTDTNIQFMTNDGAGTATKTDTGIAMVAGTSWFYFQIIADPGGGAARGLLVRLDTGAIWYGKAVTDLPTAGGMTLQMLGGLSATTGTAFVMHNQRMVLLTGTN